MATKFTLKRSTVGGVTPTTLDIDTAELAVNLADRKVFTSNGSAVFEVGSNLVNLSVTANLTVRSVIANGGLGTSGQVLHSNGTAVYWDTGGAGGGGVTSVATGNGLTGGPITTTGTVSVLANNGITANTNGLFVRQGTGAVVNATGVHVNSAYIATIQVYPASGIAVSTGTAWTTSLVAPAGAIVGTTATQTLTNKTVERLILNDGYTEEVFTVTDGVTVNLNPNNGSIQTWTLGANRTPGQANWAAGQSITLMIDDGTARTVTWSTLNVVWKTDGGVAPTLQTTGFTVIALWKVGAVIYGARVGDA